jgi:pyruvate dehydrogenase E2 component (dihydrolipoamide acetyltransferase)
MAYEFKLPDIGEGVVEGEIVRWLVAEGDEVAADQPMVEVMTDKATVEIPAPRAGRVVKRMFAEGQVCPVGQVLVSIDEGGAAAPARPVTAPTRESGASVASAATAAAATTRSPTPSAARPAPVAAAPATPASEVLATPATRKLARELDVDLGRVAGTGPAGRITSEDVKAHAGGGHAINNGAPARSFAVPPAARGAGLAAAAGPDVRIPFRGVRRKIAEHMVRSRREAAHYTYVEEVDCTQLVDLREKANARFAAQNLKLSFLPFIVRATVEALRRFPQMNALLDEAAGEIVQRRQYHIGLATATPEGLIVPVLRDADQRSIVDLGREIDRLAALTKAGKAGREELSGSTFTVTSLGQLGGVLATPILNHPEVGILGVHKIAKRPAVEGDKIIVKDLMNLSISVDHRVVDGYDAARFVADIKQSLESPGLLFLESV